MLHIYPAIFYHQNDDSYSVVFPDLNHLATEGKNLEDAMAMATDCLAGYIHTMKAEHAKPPAPTPLEQVDLSAEDDEGEDYSDERGRFVSLVSVDVESYARTHFNKSVKKTLSIPRWMNDLAVARSINFSKTLQNALRRELGIEA